MWFVLLMRKRGVSFIPESKYFVASISSCKYFQVYIYTTLDAFSAPSRTMSRAISLMSNIFPDYKKHTAYFNSGLNALLRGFLAIFAIERHSR